MCANSHFELSLNRRCCTEVDCCIVEDTKVESLCEWKREVQPLATRKMNQYAKFEAFDPDEDNWSKYAERWDMAFMVDGVGDADTDKKRAVLLTVCGTSTFALLKALSAPNTPSKVSFAELYKSLSEHCQPKPSVIIERFKFHTRTRRHDESVTEYVALLRTVTSQCKSEVSSKWTSGTDWFVG